MTMDSITFMEMEMELPQFRCECCYFGCGAPHGTGDCYQKAAGTRTVAESGLKFRLCLGCVGALFGDRDILLSEWEADHWTIQ
jgi:hypothetical protein